MSSNFTLKGYRTLTSKEKYRTENRLDDSNDQTPVNHKLAQFCRPLIRVTTVPEQEFSEVRELIDAEVGG